MLGGGGVVVGKRGKVSLEEVSGQKKDEKGRKGRNLGKIKGSRAFARTGGILAI